MAIGTTAYPTALDTATELIRTKGLASTTLTGAHDASQTTFTVADTSRFATDGAFSVDGEHITYTGKTGTTFTGCTRGAFTADGGDAAETHAGGAAVKQLVIAAHHRVLVDAIIALETRVGTSASPGFLPIAGGTMSGQILFAAGGAKLPNAVWLTARNAANSADLNLWRANASDQAETGLTTITTAGTEIILQQTGDTYGTTRLLIQNRNGVNGAIFEQNAGGAAAGVVDFLFKPSGDVGLARALRCENRSGFLATPEFEFGIAGDPALCVGDDGALVRRGTLTALLTPPAGAAAAGKAPLKFVTGTNLTTPEAGAVEYDGVTHYFTNTAAEGRLASGHTRIFRLTANGSTISTIANFFGANSAFVTDTNGVYEFVAHCYFLCTTAGTVTWGLLNSQTYTNMVAHWEGIIASLALGTAASTRGGVVTHTTASGIMPVTGTVTDALNHYFVIRALIECGTAGNIALRATKTSGGGSITPLRGSYYTVRKLPAGNSGIFA